MSSYNPHPPGLHPYYQNQRDNVRQDGSQPHSSSARAKKPDTGTQIQGATYGSDMLPGNTFPDQGKASQGLGSGQYYPHSSYPAGSYHGTSPDMQYIIQIMINLRSQLDQLNQLIAQNNQLLQSMHDQEESKCVQGSGGGAVIVRM